MNVTRNVVMNNKSLSTSEVEYEAVALAQGILDRALWTTDEEELTRGSGSFIFDNSDNNYKPSDCNFTSTKPCTPQDLEFDYEITVEVNDISIAQSSTTNKKTTVVVNSKYLDHPITKEFIKSFDN